MMLDTLLEAALRATCIAVVAAGVLTVLRVRAPAVRHRVWTVVMVAMLALPLAIAWAPDVSLRVMPAVEPQAWSVSAPPAPSVSVAAAPVESATATRVVLTPVPPWDWRPWLIAVYFAGVALLLARLVIGAVRVNMLVRDAQLVNGVPTSARVATPFTFGVLAPKILLPLGWERWSAARLAAVLEHERAHVRRRDPLVQWLALLNRAVFWFHPLAWWLERRLAGLAEEACDAAVLARGHSPVDYAEQLLELARLATGRRLPSPAVMPMSGSNLPTRIAKILDGGIEQAGSRSVAVSAAALATLAAAVLSTVTLAQEVPARSAAPETTAPRATAPRTAAQEAAAPSAAGQPTTGPRNLLEVYALALARDPSVRGAEAEYRSLTTARPQNEATLARAMAEFDAARQALLIRAAESYFAVFAAQSTLALQEAAREALARQREQTKRRFEVGLIGITDVMEIRAAADQAAANALTAQRALGEAQAVLREVVGEPVGELRPIAEDLPLVMPEPSNAEAWIEAAMERNPELAATRLRAESAGDAEARGARDDLERLARRTEAETRAAYLGVVSEISRGRALEQAVRSNQSAFQATRAGFEAGTRTTVDVLTAQSILREAETAYAHSRYDYALNVLRLRGAAGALTAEELADTEAWFE